MALELQSEQEQERSLLYVWRLGLLIIWLAMESTGVLRALRLQRVRQSQASGNSEEPSSFPFFPFPFPFPLLFWGITRGRLRYSRCCCCISCCVASSCSQGVPAARNMTPWDDALHRRNGTNKLGQEKAAAADEFWPTASKWRGRFWTASIKAGRATRHLRHASSAAKCNAECRLRGHSWHPGAHVLWSHAGAW
jgi:hypothetical protein